MAKLFMITGLGSGRDLASGKKGAFYNTLEEFHKYWDRIDIIVPKTKGVEPGEKIIFDNVHVHISSWPIFFHPIFFLKKGMEIYKEQKFDLMTVNDFPPFYNGIGARLLWQKIKVPYILELMHVPGYPKAADLKERFYKFLTKIFINLDSKKAKAIRVINEKQIPEFLVNTGIKKEKLIHIPAFYIDLETFKSIDVEKKYDLVFAARLEKNKGILNLIKAVEIIKKEKPDISLLIIGNGSLKEEIKGYIKKNNLENNVHLSGWLETSHDVAKAYSSARIFVNPSFNEGGPRVVLEAMACGIPTISTKVGLMIDIIEDGETGIFTDWDPARMANRIDYLLNDEGLQEKLSQNGVRLAQKFERREAIKNYAEKIKELI